MTISLQEFKTFTYSKDCVFSLAMKKYCLLAVVVFAPLFSGCQTTATQPDKDLAIVAPESAASCDLMPTIVEKTCEAADPTEQYLHLLLADEDVFQLELKSTEAQFQTLLLLIRKQLNGQVLTADEQLQLESVAAEELAPSWQAVLAMAQQIQKQRQQQQLEKQALEQEVDKQAELIKRLKDLSLGR